MTEKPGETPDPKAGETPDGNDDPGKGGDDLAGLREALNKERTARRTFEAEAKKNSDAAKRLGELEDANKSEVQRERDKAAAAEARAAQAETRIARLEVAAEKGLGPKLAARLVGSTREELEADADELLAQLKGDGKPAGGTPEGRGRPREALRSGSAPDAEREENDPKKLADLIPRA